MNLSGLALGGKGVPCDRGPMPPRRGSFGLWARQRDNAGAPRPWRSANRPLHYAAASPSSIRSIKLGVRIVVSREQSCRFQVELLEKFSRYLLD